MIEVRLKPTLSWFIYEYHLFIAKYFWQTHAVNFFCISDFTLAQQFAHMFL